MTNLEAYVTNTETIYSSYDDPFNGIAVRIYARTRDNEPKVITATGFDPYFYVLASEQHTLKTGEHKDLERYEETNVVPLEDRFADITPGREQRELVKVIASHPGAIPKLSDHWDMTWGADVAFTNRFRIDKDIRSGVRVDLGDSDPDDYHVIVDHNQVEPIEMMNVDPRVCVFDIETDDRDSGFPEPGDARILSIVAYDSYDDEYTAFIDLDGESIESKFGLDNEAESLSDLGITEADQLKFERNERRMLISFASYVSSKDPDIIGGWNSGDSNADGFDLPHLISRMREAGANPDRLSRENYVDLDHYGDDWKTEIRGRSTYDFMDAWASTKFTEPDSRKLDRVAEDTLDDAKIEHPNLGYFEMYDENPVLFLNYNGKDVRLNVEIVEDEQVIEFKKRLKDMVGVDWDEVRENRDFVSMSMRRKCREHGLAMVTARDNPRVREAASSNDGDVNYEGAHVLDAFVGLLENIVGVDLASLYPMTQWMLNASPDTKIDRKTAWKHDIPHVVAANGVAFRTDVDSIIRELVDEYDEIKMEYKRKRNAETPGTEAFITMALFYGVAKTIYNSFYGYTGWDKSPIYDPEIAAAVTLTGQRVIKRTAKFFADHTRGEVVYGDTDSNYVMFPSEMDQRATLEYAHQQCEVLNEEVYPELCNEFLIDPDDNRWFIELEMRAERMFMHGKKKRYAYLEMWGEGMDFTERLNDGVGEFEVTGYDCVRSSTPQITKDVQRGILEAIVTGESKSTVAEMLFDAASSIDASDPDWEYLGIPQGLGKKISRRKANSDDYYNWSKTRDTPQDAHPRGAWFANHLLDVELDTGDKPKRAYTKETLLVGDEPVDVICYEYARDLEPIAEDLRMDVPVMQEKVLRNPMKDILDAFGLEIDAALQGEAQEQTGLGAFI